MPIVHRDLKPSNLILLFITLIASCLSTPEPEPEISATEQASTADAIAIEVPSDLDPQPGFYDPVTGIVIPGGHCNVRLVECDPYPIGKGKHPRADAMCSSVCSDTVAHCADYTTQEIEFCCGHPDKNYRDSSGREYPTKHCMPSGEPNWSTRCEPGLNP
jgi:hypothetical protein